MGTATFVRTKNLGKGQDAAVYRLDPPFQSEDGPEVTYVWVSSVSLPHGDETIVFSAKDHKGVSTGRSLHRVPVQGRDHAKALDLIGYERVAL